MLLFIKPKLPILIHGPSIAYLALRRERRIVRDVLTELFFGLAPEAAVGEAFILLLAGSRGDALDGCLSS